MIISKFGNFFYSMDSSNSLFFEGDGVGFGYKKIIYTKNSNIYYKNILIRLIDE